MIRRFKLINIVFHYLFKQQIKTTINNLIVNQFESNNYAYFFDPLKVSSWGKSAFGYWIEKITKEPTIDFFNKNDKYIKTSQQAIKWYCGNIYLQINDHLRLNNLNKFQGDYVSEIISYLDEEFKECQVQENIVVVRWIPRTTFNEYYGKIKCGDRMEDSGFLSTSLLLNYDSALEFGKRQIEKYVLLIIKIKAGNNCLYLEPISGRSHEQELLLPRNTSLYVEKIYKTLFQKTIILCSVK